METRGLMMLLAGAALMLAPAAYLFVQKQEAAAMVAEAPADVAAEAVPEEQADEAAEETCSGPAIVSTGSRVDCNGDTIKDTTRRETAGGAVFVRVGD